MPSISLAVSLRGQLLSGTRSAPPAPFSPIDLFSLNEPGVWYDPSDVANLAWRRNLLTWTESFDNAAWATVGGTLTSAQSDPIGGNTAFLYTVGGATQAYNVGRSATGTFTTTSSGHAQSFYVKPNGASYVQITYGSSSNPNNAFCNFDLTDGSVGSSASCTGAITLAGNGYYRVSVSVDLDVGAGLFGGALSIVPSKTSARAATFVGDNTSGIFLWGAQLELGSPATDYQRIIDVNTEVIERFPTATLYQDTIGTIPVTTPGNTVALMLDKSKGLVLGTEKVANPGNPFTSTTGYSAGGLATVSLDAGRIKVAQTVGFTDGVLCALPNNTFATSAVISFSVDLGSSTLVQLQAGNGNFGNAGVLTANITASGTYSVLTTVLSSGANGLTFKASSMANFFLSRVSVKQLPGNHATQATAASRPTYGVVPLGGRRNLLTWSEGFDNAAWSKTTAAVTSNASVAPDGTNAADKLIAPAGGNFPRLSQALTIGLEAFVCSVYAKAGEVNFLQIMTTFVDSSIDRSWFDLSSGVAGTIHPDYTAAITDVGNGWYRCSLTATKTVAGVGGFEIAAAQSNGATSVTNTNDGILIWGAQLELGSTATAYQRVTTAFDVTEAGVQSLSYLYFNGVNTFMLTSTITPGVDRAQVFAGVRKLSDAALAAIFETSTNALNIPATISIYASSGNAANYYFSTAGTGGRANVQTANSFPAPITNVLTALGDIAGDSATLRVNGTGAGTSTTDQGTGNFLAYPLYIGMRGGGTLPFNGHLFSLLVRFGANLTTDQITDTETWVNARTGAF